MHHSYGSYAPCTYGSDEPCRINSSTARPRQDYAGLRKHIVDPARAGDASAKCRFLKPLLLRLTVRRRRRKSSERQPADFLTDSLYI